MPTARARRQRASAVAAFVAVSFITLAWRNEVQDDKVNGLIHAQAERDYQDCLRRVENVDRLNALYAGLEDIEAANPFRFTSPSTVQRRIDLFRAAQLAPPTCRRHS